MRNCWKPLVTAMVLSMTAAASLLAADAPETGQHAQKLEKEVLVTLDYLLYLPPDYNKDAAKKWPLILFLHGSGERGSDVSKVKVHGPPKVVEKDPDSALSKEFIVVSPQCPAGRGWKTDTLITLLDDVQGKYHVDADRIYLTGLSMGGFGTWDLASNYPDRFAAIVPMCGGGQTEMARRLKNLPIWVFHGDADPAVPVKRSDDMVEALKKLGADVKYTKYPGVGHDCWTRSYANPDLYTWLLSHKRGDAKAAEPVKPAPGK
jgi:predicted peptidase